MANGGGAKHEGLGEGGVLCACWSLLDSGDIKDAWLLQGQGNITIMPSPSFSMDVFAMFDGCAAAGGMLICVREIIPKCFLFIHLK